MIARADVVVVGGGIAGVSVAAALSSSQTVSLLEQEPVLAFHTTGRSAATFHSNLGPPAIRSLTLASRSHLFDPPQWLDTDVVTQRGILSIGRSDQRKRLDQLREAAQRDGTTAEPLQPERAIELHPLLRPDYMAAALWEPEAWDIDVATLHQGFVREARAGGVAIVTEAPVTSIQRSHGTWRISAGTEVIEAATVVNAAGAWGDHVAALAGVRPVGLRPLRRTAFMVPGSDAYASLPFVVDADEDFYFRPDGPQFLCSPAEEVLTEAGDPRPRDIDVALAIDRINAATTLNTRSVRSQWVGLRTFSPDKSMVIGFEPDHDGFFWLVGQGGTGIQSAPGAALLAASLIRGDALPDSLVATGADPDLFTPARFR